MEIPVQVNGRLRTVLTVDVDVDEHTLQQLALADTTVARHMVGKAMQRVIVVPGRLVNIIAK